MTDEIKAALIVLLLAATFVAYLVKIFKDDGNG